MIKGLRDYHDSLPLLILTILQSGKSWFRQFHKQKNHCTVVLLMNGAWVNNLLRNTIYNNAVHQLLIGAYSYRPAIISTAFSKSGKGVRRSGSGNAYPAFL